MSIQFSQVDYDGFNRCRQICKGYRQDCSAELILINLKEQKLHLMNRSEVCCSYSISSAEKGIGQEAGSGMTPLGLHCVREKIGEGVDPFAIFTSRVPTGEIAQEQEAGTAIVGRILWLSGLEEGLNKGNNSVGKIVDTYDRYIYIHGTNDLSRLGQPVSGGCIRMHPHDVIHLFQQVPLNTLVYMYA